MRFFSRLFHTKKLIISDTDLGVLESYSVRGNSVGWIGQQHFLGTDINIFIHGNKERVDEHQKKILLKALQNETNIQLEAEKALKETFENADIEFTTLTEQFKIISLNVNHEGFELTLEQKQKPDYLFNVLFVNNQQVGVSIDH